MHLLCLCMCVLVSLLNKFMLNYTIVGVFFYVCVCVCVCPEAISNARPKASYNVYDSSKHKRQHFGNFKYSQLYPNKKKYDGK